MNKKINKKQTTNKGFTLIEAMLSMVIVSIGVLALQSFYASILQTQALSEARITAVHMAEQIIEEWQQSNLATPPSVNCLTGSTSLVLNTPLNCTPTGSNQTQFTITATTTIATAPMPPAAANGQITLQNMPSVTDPYAGTINPDIRVVTIDWMHKGQPKSIMLTHLARLP